MPQEPEPIVPKPDLQSVPFGVIEYHLRRAMDYGDELFTLAPGVTVGVEDLSQEFTRRQQASSEFNR